ncbi:methylmalonyl Co-A mutase-associated GTPase MeaB [Yunchengibacter salinarum]|uniref:methylmalonyl Co-A mutase-associated GTPase MeaB n=1 Tax=Yunchengibacter salinarum TaxID=3133399 RepID=UPI0035B5852F
MSPDVTPEKLADGVLAGHRAAIGRAMTLVESTSPRHREAAQALLEKLLPHAGEAQRVGITGVPGVGKSTFIDNLGMMLVEQGHRLAVLAVDPSSGRTGGSILGDKTRMERLAAHDDAFIRPSPSAGVLGGVARATREAMVIVEAAGFDTVFVETVGTGQSETMVADMVDFFLVLMLPGAGDELQGIKKGVLELADMIAVNKADLFPDKLRDALREYKAALHILSDDSPNWHPPVVPVSALTGEGLDSLWQKVAEHRKIMTDSGEREARRRKQRLDWMRALLSDRVMALFNDHPDVKAARVDTEAAVLDGSITASAAVERLVRLFDPS